jgi:hypothetical protein
MAKTESVLGNFNGKIGALVFYKMRGSDTMIVRKKGYVSKYTKNNHWRYEKTRQQNKEFKGCVQAAKNISRLLSSIVCLGDFNSFGLLVKTAKIIQQMDNERPKGERSLLFSKSPSLLTGFSFNKYNTFESFVKSPVTFSIDRPNGTAQVNIPSMLPGTHLVNHFDQPYYQFVCALGRVQDLYFSENSTDYEEFNIRYRNSDVQFTPWINSKDPMPQTTFTLTAPQWNNDPHDTLVAGIGIAFGKETAGGTIEFTKYAGAGKIWMAI